MYQKYIFKVDNKEILKDEEVIKNNLSQSKELLDLYEDNGKLMARMGEIKIPVKINYMGKDKRFPTVTIKVESSEIADIEEFDKIFNQIARTESRFKQLNCTYDGISEYYASKIYDKIHKIERKGRELLKEIFFISDDTIRLQNFGHSIKEIDGDFTFSNLIDAIFKKEEIAVEELLEHVEQWIEAEEVPKREVLPKTLWEKLIGNLVASNSISLGEEINILLSEIKKARNKVTHCNKFAKKEYESIKDKINALENQFDKVIDKIESKEFSDDTISSEAKEASNEILSRKNETKQRYFKTYSVFEKYLLATTQGNIVWDNLPKEYIEHKNFFELISDKSDVEILEEVDKLEEINKAQETNNSNDIFENKDDLTIIVPAQDEGFQRVFLGEKQWYDIRISKLRRKKIRYIAGYEVSPVSGVNYWAEVDRIVPSDNYVGYWKVIFKGEPQKYEKTKTLGGAFAPQNSRYVSKQELDKAETLEGLI